MFDVSKILLKKKNARRSSVYFFGNKHAVWFSQLPFLSVIRSLEIYLLSFANSSEFY